MYRLNLKQAQRLLALGLALLGTNAAQAKIVSEAEFWRLAKAPEAVIIDVRTAQEFADEHLTGAINIPFDQIEQRRSELPRDKSQPLLIYCRSGRRAEVADASLNAMGYQHVANGLGYQQLQAAKPTK